MTKTMTRLAAFGLVLLTSVFTPLAKADEWDKRTILTTRDRIQIQGTLLEPGQYIIKVLDTADRHVLQIFDGNGGKLEMTIMAIPAYRSDPTADTQLTFAEMPNGGAPSLHTWFYPGDNSGFEFIVRR
jgi:hypothetical protein